MRRAIGAVVAIAVICIGGFYGASEWMIRRPYDRPIPAIVANHRPASVAEGERLARIGFCLGCHGQQGEGDTVEDVPGVMAVAPALARLTHDWSDGQIARAIRFGIARDGTMMHVMPVPKVGTLADDDLAAVIGWIRSLRPSPNDRTDAGIVWDVRARWALLTGALVPEAVPADARRPAHRPADVGAFFVGYSCLECHKLHEPADVGPQIAPALAPIGAAYDPAAFRQLLRTGRGMTPGDLGWMTKAARQNLRYLRDDEIVAIQAYLKREAMRTDAAAS